MKTGRLTPRTTDPITKARIENPDKKSGSSDSYGSTYMSWPDLRKEYKQGKHQTLINNPIMSQDIKNYMQGKTNILSENYREPKFTNGDVQIDHQISERAEFNDVKKVQPPVKKVQPIVKKVEKPEEITFEKLPLLKPTKITTAKKAIVKAKEKPEPDAFVNPAKTRSYKSDKSTLRNDHRLLGIDYTAKVRTNLNTGRKKLVVENVGLARKGENHIGYNREQRLFKAKSSTGASGQDFTDLSSKEIKGIRKDYLKKDLKSARSTSASTPEEAGKRAKNIAAAKMEIKQSRGAQTYSRKMEKSNLNHFTPGYNEGKNKNEDSRNDRGRIYEYKSSQDNVNNRNTIESDW